MRGSEQCGLLNIILETFPCDNSLVPRTPAPRYTDPRRVWRMVLCRGCTAPTPPQGIQGPQIEQLLPADQNPQASAIFTTSCPLSADTHAQVSFNICKQFSTQREMSTETNMGYGKKEKENLKSSNT
jgi:hypothetical protein